MAFKEKAFGAAKALWQAASRTPPSKNQADINGPQRANMEGPVRADIPGRPQKTSIWDVIWQTDKTKTTARRNSAFDRRHYFDTYYGGKYLEKLIREDHKLADELRKLYPLEDFPNEEKRSQQIVKDLFDFPGGSFGNKFYEKNVDSYKVLRKEAGMKKMVSSHRSEYSDKARKDRLAFEIFNRMIGKDKK